MVVALCHMVSHWGTLNSAMQTFVYGRQNRARMAEDVAFDLLAAVALTFLAGRNAAVNISVFWVISKPQRRVNVAQLFGSLTLFPLSPSPRRPLSVWLC